MGKLDGKVALITGAAQGGSGTAMAVRFAAEGAKVAIVARKEPGLLQTAALIKEVGGHAPLILPCDIGDPKGGRDTLVARTEEKFGPIDILVNNAVKHELKRIWEWTLEDMQSDAEVNLFAPMIMITELIPRMMERGQGWILNMSSMGAEMPPGPPYQVPTRNFSALYAAMKGAVNHMTVQGAVELRNKGVAMNTLAPQRSILTRVMHDSEIVKDKSICEPIETMAEAALALCSGDPRVLTGRIAYSLQLLVELERPVYELNGKKLLEGWQQADLIKAIQYREDWTEKYLRWPNTYEFHRGQTPYPDVLRRK
jgi:NAD(P)-dependent dehydrogenase (short-subunit alcohol dehydrogenase family)